MKSPSVTSYSPILLGATLLLSCEPTYESLCEPDDLPTRNIQVGDLELFRRAPLGGVCGPAFATAADIDGDTVPELIVAGYGKTEDSLSVAPGSIAAIPLDGSAPKVLLAEEDQLRFPHRPFPFDVDEDGDIDLIVGLGFFPCTFVPFGQPCGGLVIMRNDGRGGFEIDPIVEPGTPEFFHGVDVGDIDNDGLLDLVTVAERRDSPFSGSTAETVVFPGIERGFSKERKVLAEGLGPFPQIFDVNDDGNLDIAGAGFFGERPGYSWLQNKDGDFIRSDIDTEAGPSIQFWLSREILPGKLVGLGSNHANPVRTPDGPDARFSMFIAPDDPDARDVPWEEVVLIDDFEPENRSGQLSPGVFGFGDVNQDGFLDVVLSADGDPRIFLLLNGPDGLKPHVIADDMRQAGGALIFDVDQDGDQDIVMTAYEADAIVVFENKEVD